MSCYPIFYVKFSLFYSYLLHPPRVLYRFVFSGKYEGLYELFSIR